MYSCSYTDRELLNAFRPWDGQVQTQKWFGGFDAGSVRPFVTPGLPATDRPRDSDTIRRLVSTLDARFPYPMRSKSGQLEEVRAVIFSQVLRNGSWAKAGMEGYAKKTGSGNYLLISAYAVDHLRSFADALFSDEDFRRHARLEQFPQEILPHFKDLIVLGGVEFLLLHEMGHFSCGNYCVFPPATMSPGPERSAWIRAKEMDADAFAGERLGDVFHQMRPVLFQDIPEWRLLPKHYFQALFMMGVFAVFGIMAIQGKTESGGYPSFGTRVFLVCNEAQVRFGNIAEAQYLDMVGITRFAMSGMPLLLRNQGVQDPEILDTFRRWSVFQGSQLTAEHMPAIRAMYDEAGKKMNQEGALMPQVRIASKPFELFRVRREIWEDAAW
jgi:hypothetical protein